MRNYAKLIGSNVKISATEYIYSYGKIQTSGQITNKYPIFFAPTRQFTINGSPYSAHDIDLDLYK